MTRQNKDLISVFAKIKARESEKGRRRDKRPKPKLIMSKRETRVDLGSLFLNWIDRIAI
jgi:hypothetical protein